MAHHLVRPSRKPIIQILIEDNHADILSRLPEVIKASYYVRRSICMWLDGDEIPTSALFWISKDTEVGVLKAFDFHSESFQVLDNNSNSILLHAINQNCKAEVVAYIVKRIPYLKNQADSQGLLPTYSAHLKKNYEVLDILVKIHASQRLEF